MNPAKRLAKNWLWYDDSLAASDLKDEHIRAIYRLDTDKNCSYGSCKCRANTNNPNNIWCLNGLGEKRLSTCLLKDTLGSSFDAHTVFREPGEFVGLENLGATCYINAYLQVWFNNLFFRENILAIKFDRMELLDPENAELTPPKGQQLAEFKVKPSECLATNLQLVFTLMKESIRKSINPGFFIKAIGLDATEQQDAQEFSQLFLTLLQTLFSSLELMNKMTMRFQFGSSNSPRIASSNLINDLFQGECSYITKCQRCQIQSERHSNFIELSLNIQNSKEITECLDELIKEELLDGDNKYHCSRCDSKQNATRHMRLTRLPPVLNLQLMRFVYDRKMNAKKKLTSRIRFYEELDLKDYVEVEQQAEGSSGRRKQQANGEIPSTTYYLGAILMHVGKTAFRGHYTAQIRDFDTQEWYTFNDQVITKIKKKQQLGCTEDEVESSSKADGAKSQQTDSKGSSSKAFSTDNAYLLVYYRADLVKKMSTVITREKLAEPSNQSHIISEDNRRLEKWAQKMEEAAQQKSDAQFFDLAIRHHIYEMLWFNDAPNREFNESLNKLLEDKNRPPLNYDFSESQKSYKFEKFDQYFIATDAIRKLIECPTSSDSQTVESDKSGITQSISRYVCRHGRINPFASNKVKVVSPRAFGLLATTFGVDLSRDNIVIPVDEEFGICWSCLYSCFNYLHFRDMLKTEVKSVKEMLQLEYDKDKEEDKSIRSSNNRSQCSNKSTPKKQESFIKKKKKSSDDDEEEEEESEDDIIVLEEISTPSPSSSSSRGSVGRKSPSSSQQKQRTPARGRDWKRGVEENDEGDNKKDDKKEAEEKSTEKWRWVGLQTLRQWQTLASRCLEKNLPSSRFDENKLVKRCSRFCDHKKVILENDCVIEYSNYEEPMDDAELIEVAAAASNTSASASTMNNFNEDIICDHGKLSTTKARRLVHPSLWKFFGEIFKQDSGYEKSSQFTSDAKECEKCLDEDKRKAKDISDLRVQKEQLSSLYANEKRPDWEHLEVGTTYYLVTNEFLNEWRSMIRTSSFWPIIIRNSLLLCQHGLVARCTPNDVSLLEGQEWFMLRDYYDTDKEITVTKKHQEEDGYEYIYEFSPNRCEPCIEQHEIDRRMFVNKKIFVRMSEDETPAAATVEGTTSPLNMVSFSLSSPSSPSVVILDENTAAVESIYDDELDSQPCMKKARRMETKDQDWSESSKSRGIGKRNTQPPKETTTAATSNSQSKQSLTSKAPSFTNGDSSQAGPTRRSQRQRGRTKRDDIAIDVSSSDSIKEIKKKIASKTAKMISEQRLYLNGIELENDRKIIDYDINPGDVLTLKIDKMVEDDESESLFHPDVHYPENGFKGTNLCK